MTDKIIGLKIDEDYKGLGCRYSDAYKIFEKFQTLEKLNVKKEKLFNILIKLIELVEINPVYNYYFLKYHKNIKEYYSFNPLNNKKEKYTYQYNFDQLKETLKENHYFELSEELPISLSIGIYQLMILYLSDEKKFFEESKKIEYHHFNSPLIDSIERLRMFYYKQLFKYPSDPKDHNSNKHFNNICKGIKIFKSIIGNMKNWIYSINLDDEEINKKFFIFMINLEMINCLRSKNAIAIKRIYEKEFTPNKEEKAIKSKLNNENNGLLSEFLIEEDNDNIELISKFEILDKNEFRIYNKYESVTLKRENYALLNLIDEIREFPDYPIKYLIERNQTYDTFFLNNKNFINEQNLFPDFIKYLKNFMKSNVIKEALYSSNKHGNIIKLLDSDYFINSIIDDKHIISLPLNNKVLEGYTNKDFLVSGISGFPFIITGYEKIETEEEYNNIKNLAFIFNISMKLLICLHEIIIHLGYGYLFIISDGKIFPESPKSDKNYSYLNIPKDDGGSYFEELLFGERISKITFNFAIRLLNGNFTSLENFRKELKEPIDLNDKSKQGDFLQKILSVYKINTSFFKGDSIYGTFRCRFDEISYYRENFYTDCKKI